jgi:hypothetical protein
MVAMPVAVRAHLTPAVRLDQALDANSIEGFAMSVDGDRMTVFSEVDVSGAWVLSTRTVNPDGTTFTGPVDTTKCGFHASSPDECQQWLGTLGLRQEARYIPESRFWALQFTEAGLFLGMALLLGAGSFWWLRRRLS